MKMEYYVVCWFKSNPVHRLMLTLISHKQKVTMMILTMSGEILLNGLSI